MGESFFAGKILDGIKSIAVYVIRADNHKILYFNEKVRSVVPSVKIGDICDEVFNGSCFNCPLKEIGDRDCCSTINFNDPFGRFVDISASRIMWDDNVPAFIITVSEHHMMPDEQEVELERRRLNLAVAAVFPMIISVNLTKNSYKMMEYDDFISAEVPRQGSFDELISLGASVIHKDFKEDFDKCFSRENLLAAFAAGSRDVYMEFRQKRGGSYHWVSSQIIPIENPFSSDVLVIILHRVIDKQKEMEKRLRDTLDAAVSNMPGFTAKFIVKDDNAYVLEAGDKFYEYFETSPGDYESGIFWRISDAERKRILARIKVNTRRGLPVEFIHIIRRLDGSTAWIKLSGSYLYHDGGYPVYYAVFVDITDVKRLQLDMEAAFNSLPGGVLKFAADDRLSVLEANSAFYEMIGSFSRDYGLRFLSFIYGPDAENTMAAIKRQTEEKQPVNVEFRVESPDGTLLWMHLRGQEIGSKNGRPVYQAVLLDVTEQKKAQHLLDHENRLLQERFVVSVQGIYSDIYELDYAANACYSLKFDSGEGFSRVMLPGCIQAAMERISSSQVHPEDAGKFKAVYDLDYCSRSFDKGAPEVYTEFRRKERGGYVWFCAHIRPSGWDKNVCLVYFRNIGAIKAEAEEKERTLSDALAIAEKASKAKSDFLSRVSHDIRTPMNAIVGMASIAKTSLGNNARVEGCLDKIMNSSRSLLSVISNILDMSDIECGKLVLSKELFRFSDFMEDISGDVRRLAEDKGITFTPCSGEGMEEFYEGDKVRLKQVFINILSNAVKFTEPGGKICLAAAQTEAAGGSAKLRFIISDTGRGIDGEFLSRMFRPFEQAAALSLEEYGGNSLGLGLPIARSLVNLMGGSIWVESKQGEGSVFTIDVRLGMVTDKTCGSLSAAKPRSDSDYDFSGKRALLAEDDDINAEIAVALLGMRGMAVDAVENGLEAVNRFVSSEQGYYDIILMDIRMPVMDGLTAILMIRALERPDAALIPIAAITANTFKEDIDKAKACLVNGYIVKPVEKDKLYSTVDILLKGGSCFEI